jgi:hypothetical protein
VLERRSAEGFSMKTELTKKLIPSLAILLFVCFVALIACPLMIAEDALRLHFLHKAEARIYQEKLGIGHSDKEVETFMTEQLKGLTHPQALAKLAQWADVEAGDCPASQSSARCVIYVDDFLGTRAAYEFTVFYRNGRVVSVVIYYS